MQALKDRENGSCDELKNECRCTATCLFFFSKSNSVLTFKRRTYFLPRGHHERERNVMEVYCKSIVDTKDLIKQLEEIIEEQETIIAK